jgi:hypothetical protein
MAMKWLFNLRCNVIAARKEEGEKNDFIKLKRKHL